MSKVIEIDPRYPIGEYQPQPFSIDQKVEWMADIKFLPLQLENAVLNLDEIQLQTPYRDDGWTVNQVVHHVADSHMNAFMRFKLSLTEDTPQIKPYNQDLWASTKEASKDPVESSVLLLEGLHTRWTSLLKSMTTSDFERCFYHPENNLQDKTVLKHLLLLRPQYSIFLQYHKLYTYFHFLLIFNQGLMEL